MNNVPWNDASPAAATPGAPHRRPNGGRVAVLAALMAGVALVAGCSSNNDDPVVAAPAPVPAPAPAPAPGPAAAPTVPSSALAQSSAFTSYVATLAGTMAAAADEALTFAAGLVAPVSETEDPIDPA